ncbi:hypothetical protein PT974_08187 [Cladobotryum mycophilum]|uniref:Uncharacterized protein n=1 Tax=Cladobotryum mycophilum TaxID=491253 RepID=A0ABR0SCN4_9HYPO
MERVDGGLARKRWEVQNAIEPNESFDDMLPCSTSPMPIIWVDLYDPISNPSFQPHPLKPIPDFIERPANPTARERRPTRNDVVPDSSSNSPNTPSSPTTGGLHGPRNSASSPSLKPHGFSVVREESLKRPSESRRSYRYSEPLPTTTSNDHHELLKSKPKKFASRIPRLCNSPSHVASERRKDTSRVIPSKSPPMMKSK